MPTELNCSNLTYGVLIEKRVITKRKKKRKTQHNHNGQSKINCAVLNFILSRLIFHQELEISLK